jgi:hypothetical protein
MVIVEIALMTILRCDDTNLKLASCSVFFVSLPFLLSLERIQTMNFSFIAGLCHAVAIGFFFDHQACMFVVLRGNTS